MPGTPEMVTVSAVAIESAIVLLGFPEVAAMLAPVVAAAPFETTRFCQADPPTDPGLTLDIIANALNFAVPSISIPAQLQVSDWFYHWYWYQICGCVGASHPTAPPPSNPNTSVGDNPGLPGPKAVGVCWSASTTVTIPANAPFDNPQADMWAQLMPAGNTGRQQFARPPSGATLGLSDISGWGNVTGTFTIQGDTPSVNGAAYGMLTQFASSLNPVAVTTQALTTVSGSSGGTIGFLQNQATQWAGIGTYNPDSVAHTLTFTWEWQCGSTLLPTLPCCPPDPLLESYLRQILGIVQNLHNSVAPQLPSTWTDGLRHSALREAGSFTINPKAIGVRVEVTTLPSPPQQLPGDPLFYFNMGFVTPIALSSPLRGWRLVFQKQSFELPEFTDSIGYTLLNGTVADVVELLPVFATTP